MTTAGRRDHVGKHSLGPAGRKRRVTERLQTTALVINLLSAAGKVVDWLCKALEKFGPFSP